MAVNRPLLFCSKTIAIISICLSLQTSAYGELSIDVREAGPDVLATFSGSLELFGLVRTTTIASASGTVRGVGGFG